MPIKIKKLDPKTGKPKKDMPLPKPKPRYANPKHPMNTERTGPLRKAKGGKLEMVEKGGKKVPFFAADGVGKMAAGGSMKIKSGDTLSQIAKSKGITLKSLLAANPGIKNANKIRVGQSIKIPGATAGAGAKSSNPYAGMTKTQMRMMDVKNKDSRKQEAATRGMQAQGKMGGQRTPTKTSKDPKLDELRSRIKRAAAAKKAAPKAAPKPRTKQGGETVKSTMKKAGKTVMSAAKSGFLGPRAQGAAEIVNNAPNAVKAAKSLRLRRGKPPQTPSMSGLRDDDFAAKAGGMMNKKVMAYKKGGVMRGTGAATKGKGFSGSY